MEVVLEDFEGMPEGGLLSIKVGESKRQLPVNKSGQSFRFATSPMEPLPLKVELLTPAAPPQLVNLDPTIPRFDVHFGHKMKVSLVQREDKSLLRPLVESPADQQPLADAPQDKQLLAQKAANYLQEHDLVRAFQETLHSVLVAKPDDPHKFIEERFARARRMREAPVTREAPAQQPAPGPVAAAAAAPVLTREMPEPVGGGGGGGGGGSTCRNKVESLFAVLSAAHENLKIVLPLLPRQLRELLQSQGFDDECRQTFTGLDTTGEGKLAPRDLLPVIVDVTTAKLNNITMEQCRRFANLFDSNQDGVICLDEFRELVRFIVVAGFLESETGKATVELAKVEESAFQDFLNILEADKERLWTILPLLPQWLVDHVGGTSFQKACNEHFEALDVDKSGALEPHELMKVVRILSEAHPLIIDLEKCRRFSKVFDKHKNGVILRDEFLEFAQFLTVMNFLSTTEEGKEVKERAALNSNNTRLARFITMLTEDPAQLNEVLRHMPQALVFELTNDAFVEACRTSFAEQDKDGYGVLDPAELFPAVCQFTEAHPFRLNLDQCRAFAAMFDKERSGVISKALFPRLVRYIFLMAYLRYAVDHEEMLVQDVILGQDKIQNMLEAMKWGVGQIQDIVPCLPEDLLEELSSPSFEAQCMNDFEDLDKDRSGVLEPKELIPVILHLSSAHHYALTEEHCMHFVDLFDSARNGVITRDEFTALTRFLLIMAYLETQADYDDSRDFQVVEASNGQQAVEELLYMLEHDREALHKVIPLLPVDIFTDLSSDRFVLECHDAFQQLDQERKGYLVPKDLFPVVVAMSKASPYAVSLNQCQRFTDIFDVDHNGVLLKEEFVDFSRFVCIMSYLQTPMGKEAAVDALPILHGSRRIEELLATMARDRANMRKVIPFLPDWLRKELLSQHFTIECLDYFSDLDKDGSGSLDPQELYPMVLALANVHRLSLDMAQLRRFTVIFDDARTGVVSKDEFVNFSRFMLIMSFLNSQEGKKILSLSEETARPGVVAAECLKDENKHLAVDCDFFRGKADRLEAENSDLHRTLADLQASMRRMQAKMDEQEMRLRHAEVGLRTR